MRKDKFTIEELEERLELGGWMSGDGGSGDTCPACGEGEDADHSDCSCDPGNGGIDIQIDGSQEIK